MRHFKTVAFAGALVAWFTCAAIADDFSSCQKESGQEAIEACNRAIRSGRYNDNLLAYLFLYRGAVWVGERDDNKAYEDYQRARDLNPDIPAIYNNIGQILERRGKLEDAITNYDRAIRMDPKYTAAYTNRGLALESMKDYPRARASFRKALDVPAKWNDGEWAQRTAREKLEELKDK